MTLADKHKTLLSALCVPLLGLSLAVPPALCPCPTPRQPGATIGYVQQAPSRDAETTGTAARSCCAPENVPKACCNGGSCCATQQGQPNENLVPSKHRSPATGGCGCCGAGTSGCSCTGPTEPSRAVTSTAAEPVSLTKQTHLIAREIGHSTPIDLTLSTHTLALPRKFLPRSSPSPLYALHNTYLC